MSQTVGPQLAAALRTFAWAYAWCWGWEKKTQDFGGVGKEPDGNRWNDCHYSNAFKRSINKG